MTTPYMVPDPSQHATVFLADDLLSKLPPGLRHGRINQFYVYDFNFLPLALSATSTATINVQADADFVVLDARCIVTDTTDAVLSAFVPQLVQMRDNGAGYLLMQNPIHFNAVYGDAQLPGFFKMPYLLRASCTLAITHQNLEATARNVRGALCGFRSWPDPNYAGD